MLAAIGTLSRLRQYNYPGKRWTVSRFPEFARLSASQASQLVVDSNRPADTIRRLVNGYQMTQAISVAVTLGVPDLLAAGPLTSAELATATGSHADSLYRLLRALASIGIFQEESGRRFSLTELGAELRTDAPKSIAGWSEHTGEHFHWNAWGGLLHSVRTGENAYELVNGMDTWTLRSQHPEASAIFDRAMTSQSLGVVEDLLAEFDFGRFPVVVDVGGGNGKFLSAILARHTAMRGVLLDLPHVVSGAGAVMDAAGVANRCEVIGGSFFDAVPPGGHAYILKSVIHDWEDGDCLRILEKCRQAMDVGRSLLLVERELGNANERWENKFSDLNMLTGPGGRERTAEEYAALVAATGFRFIGVTPSASGRAVFESVAV